ncbi:hypothetical protein XELAEV_18019538mg [Xenopus laevis]|uniref:G-protein coupled receptors family 1 profile domain-containing protein n=1 Tax=Xenopus laevis TaxID=8355 RepID=A0A974DHH9_XENLA|nr:hypothetical protein XELAEV_18019538mg [Xenopus laevis]
MREKNQTLVSEIVLLGFQNLHNVRVPLFFIFLLIYILTFYVLVIVLVSTNQNLQAPMYFFLWQLALTDLLGSSTVAPTLLNTVIHDGTALSLAERFDCILLAVMSYDRYVSICIPLRYSSIMSHRVCGILTLISWVINIFPIIFSINMITTLQFCNQNTVNHFFCDFMPLAELSCSATSSVQMDVVLQSTLVIISPFMVITGSYICIAHEILKIKSNIGRQKAFSTCSSHLAVISIFYGTLIVTYDSSQETNTDHQQNSLSVIHCGDSFA